ncbi:DUF2207 domain-containing protein [Patescibacteria group bacterium]|nr:DUF2207 domain-containing protein [Patescibacteria group bacterium]
MKINNKRNLALILFATFFFLLPYSKALAEKIQNFESNIKINEDGTVTVEEIVNYDFGSLQRHGFFRKLDYKNTNQDGKTFIVDIDVLSITDDEEFSYNFSKSRVGRFVELKIGDANKFVTGQNTYVIRYILSGAVTYFSDHDEFYWNLVGFEWDVPIENYRASITLPENVNEDLLKAVCYEGALGSTSQSCTVEKLNGQITVESSRVLNPGENITVAVSFPKGIVEVLEPKEDKPGIFTYVILVILALFAVVWYLLLPIRILIKTIRESKFVKNNERIVSAWFEPPQYSNKSVFTPAETGFIVDKVIDHKELTATIIDLAQRGFLKIREDGKKHFSFIRLKEIDSSELKNFEQQVMSAIFKEGVDLKNLDEAALKNLDQKLPSLEKFNSIIKIPQLINLENEIKGTPIDVNDEVKDSDLKKSKTLFGKISKFNKYVEDEIVEKGMFENKPSEIYSKNMALFGLGLTTLNPFLAIVSFIARRKTAKMTLKGIEKYSEAKSLLNFLKSQDEQLNFQSKNQMFFEKLLPYAAAFGVEKIWAERFKEISMIKPDWYEGNNFANSVFIGNMTHNIGGSMKSAHSASMSPTRSSSGFSSGFSGGSSGGGGGGGGGGSW